MMHSNNQLYSVCIVLSIRRNLGMVESMGGYVWLYANIAPFLSKGFEHLQILVSFGVLK